MAAQRENKSSIARNALPDFVGYLLIGSSVIIIPFLFSSRLLDPVLSLRFTVFSVSLFVIVLLIAIYNKSGSFDLSILRRRIFPIFIFYLGISALSLLNTINLPEGIFELLKIWLGIIFFGAAALVLASTPNSILRLTKAVIIASAASAIIGVCQYYGVAFNSLPGYYVVYGTMVNKNLFASYLFLMLPFSLYGFFFFRNNWDLMGGLASILSLWCIVLGASRAAWLAVLVLASGVILIWFFTSRRVNPSKKEMKQLATRATILVVVFLTLVGFSYPHGSESKMEETPLKEKITSAANVGAGSAQVRLQLWKKTLNMISDHPYLGVGLGNWKINIPRYGTNGLPSEQGKVQYIRPHNDFLWVLSEAGPLGLLAYLSLFGISLYYLFKTLSRAKNLEEAFILLMMLFGIIGFLVISWFSFPKERIVHSIFIILLLIVILVKYHKLFSIEEARSLIPFPPLLLISLVILVVAGVVGIQRIHSEAHLIKAYEYWDRNRWDGMIEEAGKAQSIFVSLDHNATPISWLRGIAYISLSQKELALRELEKAVEANPNHLQALDNLATCYELLGDHSNAIKYYHRVIEISPHFENSLRNLSVIYYNMGKYDEALQAYSQADLYSGNQKLLRYLEIYRTKIEQMNR